MKRHILLLLLVGLLSSDSSLICMDGNRKRKRDDQDHDGRIPKKRKVVTKKPKMRFVPINYKKRRAEAERKKREEEARKQRKAEKKKRSILGKRKRDEGDSEEAGEPKKKRRKGTSVYEQYLQPSGRYLCPELNCSYTSKNLSHFRNHLSEKRHGHLKGTEKKKRKSICDQYLDSDGRYRCTSCNFASKSLDSFTIHLSRERHGHLKNVEKQKSESKYDQYLGNDGKFHCPCCNYVNENSGTFIAHLSKKRHGHLKGVEKQKSESKYDQYLGDDGKYHCPELNCSYANKNPDNLAVHFSEKRHGHLKGIEKRKFKNKFDQYLGNDGQYHCPEPKCGYSNKNPDNLAGHFSEKRHGHLKGVEKRKHESIYDQYLGDDGKYRCPEPNCHYANEKLYNLQGHFIRHKHGEYKHKEVQKKESSVYDQYLGNDGKYHCPEPNCSYANKNPDNLAVHFSENRHGHLKGVEKQKRESKYDRYLGDDGKYHCPDCGHTNKSFDSFSSHIFTKRHAHLKNVEKQKSKSKYDQYLGNDGKYHCPEPNCGYVGEKSRHLRQHFATYKHGHYKHKEIQKKGSSKYNQYLGNDGQYHCPHCDYAHKNLKTFATHLSKNRHGHLKNVEKQKIKRQKKHGEHKSRKSRSKFDQYLQNDGKYHCDKPGCNYAHENLGALKQHFRRDIHGTYIQKKGLQSQTTSKYNQYLKNDGTYHCSEPDCDYTTKNASSLLSHFQRKRHGHFKNKAIQKKGSKYDKYLQSDGKYHCPEPGCGYTNEKVSNLTTHFYREKHGDYKNKPIQKKGSKYDAYLGPDKKYYCNKPNCNYSNRSLSSFTKHLAGEKHGQLYENGKLKRRKRPYEKYLDDDGYYYCSDSDCDFATQNITKFRKHCKYQTHGPYKNREVKKRKSKYDQYLGADRKYRCPDCNFATENPASFKGHIAYKRHGHLKDQKKTARKETKKIDVYKRNGKYHCPNCDFSTENVRTFRSHLVRKKHGQYKDREVKKRKSKYDQYLGADGKYHCPRCKKYASTSASYFSRHFSANTCTKPRKWKKPSLFDQYFKNGAYHCSDPDCDYSSESLKNFKTHLSKQKHGHLKTTKKKKVKSKYEQYFKDGKYHCFKPKCNYSHEKLNFLTKHLARAKHGPYYKDGKMIRWPTKYDQFLEGDTYYCDCGQYSTKTLHLLRSHMARKKHGIHKQDLPAQPEQDLPPISPEEAFSFPIEEDDINCLVTILPTFVQQDDGDSIFHALFTAVCFNLNDDDTLYDFTKLNELIHDLKERWNNSEKNRDAIIQIIKSNPFFQSLTNNTDALNDHVFIIDTPNNFNKEKLFANDGTPKIIILHIGQGCWVAVKLTRQEDQDSIEIADSTYQEEDMQSISELYEIITRWYQK